MATTTELEVFLGETLVGWLRRREHHDEITFTFAEGYLGLPSRPVLGQWFLDHLGETIRSRVRVPPFFANLLPEGALRELVARRAGVAQEREMFLLAELGEDLPGAVRIVAQSLGDDSAPDWPPEGEVDAPMKFSLAGVQLKLSVIRADEKLTFPATGRGGDWIVKIPAGTYPELPENEWSMLQWARETGIRTADAEIINVANIERLPRDLAIGSPRALAVRRFDRLGGERVHIEDFAQVLGAYPTRSEKYKAANFETLANIVRSVVGTPGFDEFLRRLVFVIAIGNGDAHIKNWSLIYPDRTTAELSPAYDFVSTIQYLPHDDLGLNLARNKVWERISIDDFRRLARKTGESEERVVELVRHMVSEIRTTWNDLSATLPLSQGFRQRIEAHWLRLPLLQSG